MDCKVCIEGGGDNQRIYLCREGEDYPRFYPDNFRVNIRLDEERRMDCMPTCVANLYFSGRLSKTELDYIHQTKRYVYFSKLTEMMQNIEGGLRTFNDYKELVMENTTYNGRRVFKSYEDIFLFDKDFNGAINLEDALLYNNAYIQLPRYEGNIPDTTSICHYLRDKDLCVYIADQVIGGNLDIIDEIFYTINLGIPNVETVLKKKYVYGQDISNEFNKVEKRKNYYDKLHEIKKSLWYEGVYKIGDDGYIINPEYGKPFFINREEIPSVWEMDKPSASRMIARGKFKMYASMGYPHQFMRYWENLSYSTRQSVLNCLKKIKDDTYDFLLTYLITS